MPGPRDYVVPLALFPSQETIDAVTFSLSQLFDLIVWFGSGILVLALIIVFFTLWCNLSRRNVPSLEAVRLELQKRAQDHRNDPVTDSVYKFRSKSRDLTDGHGLIIRGNIYAAILRLDEYLKQHHSSINFLEYHYDMTIINGDFITDLVEHVRNDSLMGLEECRIIEM